MNNASTADGRGQDRPNEAEPFFPSEGSFNTVVPLSEIGRAPVPAPLVPVDPADVGRPAEAAWARKAHRAGWKDEEETTLIPGRAGAARGVRQSWAVTAAVITLSVAAGLVSGTYLIWSAQHAPLAQTSAQVTVEAPSLPPAPVVEQVEAVAKVEKVKEAVKDEKAVEVTKVEKPVEVAHAPKEALPSRPTTAPRAERATRDAAEAREITPSPKPARSQSAASPRPRVTTAEKQPPAPTAPARSLPVSSPPPSAKSRKVIQWP
ncbi:MAG: hypothetical protein QOH49_3814 [Acidobacteriota bacterium]|jgi:hypothetical protein|nr:hypothetical protein [Acidobacteriota bacterium]